MPPADADPIAALLAGTYADPDGGPPLRCEARAIAIADTLVDREVELVDALDLGDRRTTLGVISDVDTAVALGERVERALASRYAIRRACLPRRPHADVETIDRLVAMLAPGVDAIVAVGSGTINDLAKMVALRLDVPQLVFATAPSMNGYTSVSASITERGFKRSVRARTPIAVFVDLGVFAAAPLRLVRAGLGDSACRPTAQSDWLLATALVDPPVPYREAPFAMLAADEAILFAEAEGLARGDLVAHRALARTLVLSGFGMTACGGSFPASQGEHLISHYLEMMGGEVAHAALHGEQTGVAALAMARLQARILAEERAPVLLWSKLTRETLRAHYGDDLGDACWRECEGKLPDRDLADIWSARLEAAWPALRARIGAIAIEPARLEAILVRAGAPTTPVAIGIPERLFFAACMHAREIRDRYTFLDLAADMAGHLDWP